MTAFYGQIFKITVLPVTAGCILRVLIEQAIRSAAFGKKVIKIEKCRTKSVDLRPLFGISFYSSKKRDLFPSL
jgi:hypothetical protein